MILPQEMFAFGFQHLPQDLANVNEWKIMFDPYIKLSLMLHLADNYLQNCHLGS